MRIGRILFPVFLSLAIFLSIFFVGSAPVYAVWNPAEGLVPCGNTVTVDTTSIPGKICYIGECTLCHVQVLILKITDFLFFVVGIMATLLFIQAGFLYATASSNASNIGKAHKIFKNTAIGFVIFLSAYMIVDIVMKTIYAESSTGWGPWNAFLCKGASLNAEGQATHCVDVIQQATLVGQEFTVPTQQEVNQVNVPKGPVPDGGVCGTENLKRWFPENKVDVAHCVCMQESGGSPKGGDLCQPSGPAVSWGYWQLNLTVHKPGGLNCPAAFNAGPHGYTGSNKQCSVKDQALYDQCKAAANDPTVSFTYAVAIYNHDSQNGGNGFRQWSGYKDANCSRFEK